MTFDPPGVPPAGTPGGGAGEAEGWWDELHQPPWWEDGRGFDEGDGWAPFPRRRRSRAVRVTGAVVAGALVLASVSTTVEVVLGGSQRARAGRATARAHVPLAEHTSGHTGFLAGTVVGLRRHSFIMSAGTLGDFRVLTSGATRVGAGVNCGAPDPPVRRGDQVYAQIGPSNVATSVLVNPVAGRGTIVSVTASTSVLRQTNSGGTLQFGEVRLNVGDATRRPRVTPSALVAGGRVHYGGYYVAVRGGVRTVAVCELT